MNSSDSRNKKNAGLRCIVVETVNNKPPDDYKHVYLKLAIGFSVAFAFIFYSHQAALIGLWKLLVAHFAGDWWLLIAAAALFAVGISVDEKNRGTRGLLRVTRVDTKGIVMGRPGQKKTEATYFIPWNMLTCVESGIDESGKQPYEFVMLRMGNYLAYKLRRDIGFNWVDEQTLLTKARQHAPNAKYLIERSSADVKRSDARYTNIWLQYLAPSGQRLRKGQLQPGDMLNRGRFEVVRVLGAGGQGTAYLAKVVDGPDVEIADGLEAGNLVAIKEYILPMHANDGLSMRLKDSLDNEAKILSGIEHPNIVTLYDCFVEDHRGYMVLEYIDGPSLRAHIKSTGPAKSLLVVWWALEICSILRYLQSLKPPIVHRDLTPDNLIWKGDRHVKLFDFTVAHKFEAQRLATIVGKQSYMAPEQVKGLPCPQSDIYSLGATMYFLLTGEDPEPLSVASPRTLNPDVDEQLDRIVQRCMQFDLKKRYADPSEIEKDLSVISAP